MWDDSPPVLCRCVDPLSVGPRADAILYSLNVPSEKLLIASFDGESATYLSVTFGSPSLIIKCTMISALNTIVHVESLKRFCRVRNISATPASPAWVATRICSTYLALGGASYFNAVSRVVRIRNHPLLALIFVPPLTDFSKDPDIPAGRWRDMSFEIESTLRSRLQLGPVKGAGKMAS